MRMGEERKGKERKGEKERGLACVHALVPLLLLPGPELHIGQCGTTAVQ
jgi:hypothetical protein